MLFDITDNKLCQNPWNLLFGWYKFYKNKLKKKYFFGSKVFLAKQRKKWSEILFKNVVKKNFVQTIFDQIVYG